MRTLYHFSLCPFSRKIRLLLREKDIAHEPVTEPFWEERPVFTALSPLGKLPVLIEEDMTAYVEHEAIAQYLEEAYPETALRGQNLLERAQVRTLCQWFDVHFAQEVTLPVLEERLYKFLRQEGEPDTKRLQLAYKRMVWHLELMSQRLQLHPWLGAGGERFTLADISAAAQISVLDYFSEITWRHYPSLKAWYAVVKSRPSFRPLLSDRVPGFKPPAHYADLDF